MTKVERFVLLAGKLFVNVAYASAGSSEGRY